SSSLNCSTDTSSGSSTRPSARYSSSCLGVSVDIARLSGSLAGPGFDALDAKQLAHRVGRLSPTRQPAARTLLGDHDRRGARLRVVVTDRLDHTTIAGGALVGDDHAPHRFLLAAHSREPEPHCHVFLSAGCLLCNRELRRCARRRPPSPRGRGALGVPYRALRMSAPMSGILPRPIPRMTLRICPNCLTRRFTCWTLVPEPRAIRSLRDPLISSGRRRSCGVIERMIAWIRSSSRSSTFMFCSWAPASPGIIPSRLVSGPIRRIVL